MPAPVCRVWTHPPADTSRDPGKGARSPFRPWPWQREIVGQLFPARGARPRQGLVSVEGAEVVVVASDFRQAGITLRQVARMIELDGRLAEQVQVFQSRIYLPHTHDVAATLAEQGAPQVAVRSVNASVVVPAWWPTSAVHAVRDRSRETA